MGTKMKSTGDGRVQIGSIDRAVKKPKMDKVKGISFGVLLAGKVADGSKTVTRRVVKDGVPFGNWDITARHCPYQVGQLLYVREPWRVDVIYDKPSGSAHIPDGEMVYWNEVDFPFGGRMRLARFLPKRLARTWLRVTGVRHERLLDISEADAIDEGIRATIEEKTGDGGWTYGVGELFFGTAAGAFFHLWDSINGKNAHLQNPWVWVISFERVEMANPLNAGGTGE